VQLRLSRVVFIALCLGCADRGTPDNKQLASHEVDSVAPDTSEDPDVAEYVAQVRWDFDQSVAAMRSAVTRTGLDSRYTAPLLGRLALSDSVWRELRPRPDAPDTALPTVLERWFEAAKDLSNHRRAAAYFAADQLLAVGFTTLGLWDRSPASDSVRQRMMALGARIGWSDANAAYSYGHSWLLEAIQLDSNGVTGVEARLWRLANWCFATRGGGDNTEDALAEATDLLRLGIEPAKMALAHFYAGDANRDVVAFARDSDFLFIEPAAYQSREPAAREAAIAHYRAGLLLDSLSRVARSAAAELRLLVAGEVPHHLSFGCWQGE
jgi:hypothetical protein